jgi:hypothetical protein
VIKTFLFEIQCAEDIGNYKLADTLSSRLVKIAGADYKNVRKKLIKDFVGKNDVKQIEFSQSTQKFIVYADASLDNAKKEEIRQSAKPFLVSFKYS